jgi:maltose O-acetyltransferase
MKKKQIRYLLDRTFQESVISLFNLADLIIPDLTIFSPIRRNLANLIWNIGKKTRMRKSFRANFLGNLKIGNNCYINRNNLFDNKAEIKIGSNCLIGFDNKFLTVSHTVKNKKGNKKDQETIFSRPIKIGENVWITTNCVILPGTEIGDNSVIGAGAIVRGKLESGWVYAGNPIKKIHKTKGVMIKKY